MLNFRGAQHLMRDAELAGSCDGVLHKGRGAVMAAGRACRGQNQAAVADQQAAAGGGFQFFPDLMGAQDQRNEIAAFADGLTSDARVPVPYEPWSCGGTKRSTPMTRAPSLAHW